MPQPTDFDDVLFAWQQAERTRLVRRIAYDRAYAKALVEAEGPVEIRKAKAELASISEREAADLAAVDAAALRLTLEHLSHQSHHREHAA